MKGILFYDNDRGRGGPDGYLAHYQKWCIEIDGKKFHISSSLTGFPVQRDVSVEPCDGECTKLVALEGSVWEKALPLLNDFSPRAITPEEKSGLDPDLAKATYLSEINVSYMTMRQKIDQFRNKVNAGMTLFDTVATSWLGRFIFRHILADYTQKIRENS